MARRGGATARADLRGLLRLADNPDFDDMDDGDADDEEYLDDLDDDGLDKGREVHGPRTKLSASVDRLYKGYRQLQASQSIIAQGLLALLTKADDDDDDEEEDDKDDEKDSKEDKARVRQPASSTRLNKDDAASSFGEKDDDTPGNRPFDPTNTKETDTMIQEGPGAGPGPVNKGVYTLTGTQLQEMMDTAVRKSQESKVALASTAPNPGSVSTAAAAMSGQLNNGDEDVSWTDPEVRKMSFAELERLRVRQTGTIF